MNKNTIGYIAIVVLLISAGFFSLNMFLSQRSDHDKLDIRTFPYTLGGWKGKDLRVTEKEYKILETRNLIYREYVNGSGEKAHLFIIYSETNRSVFHPPEVCLIGSGFNITDKTPEEIAGEGSTFNCNKLYIEKGDARHLSLYCYKAGSFYTDNYYLQQAIFAFNQLLGRHRAGATIRASMAAGEDETKTLGTLKAFLKEAIARLPK